MRITINELSKVYNEIFLNENSLSVDDKNRWWDTLSYNFWQLKKVRTAFEKYIGTEENPKRINPNYFDTPTYYLMKPSEQGNVEGMFMDEVLTGVRKI